MNLKFSDLCHARTPWGAVSEIGLDDVCKFSFHMLFVEFTYNCTITSCKNSMETIPLLDVT